MVDTFFLAKNSFQRQSTLLLHPDFSYVKLSYIHKPIVLYCTYPHHFSGHKKTDIEHPPHAMDVMYSSSDGPEQSLKQSHAGTGRM